MYPQASSSCENIRTGSAGDCSHELKVVGDKLIVTIDGCKQEVTLPSGGGGSAATCASISALFNTPMTATMATKLFTSGCGTITLEDVKAAIVASGAFDEKQVLAIVGRDLKISVTDSLVNLSAIVAGGLTAPMSVALKDALSESMATALSAPVSPSLNTAVNSVVNNALATSTTLATKIDGAIVSKVNCAFVSGLYPASASPISGFEKLLSADCKSIDIDALALYVGENLPGSAATLFSYDAITKKLKIAVDGQATPLEVDLGGLGNEGSKLVINGQNLELQNSSGDVLSSTAIGQLDAQQLIGAASPTGYKLTLSNGGEVIITCADIGQMYPTGTATAATEVLTKDCKSAPISSLPIAPNQLTAGALPTTVTVSGSSINSPITNPLATVPAANITGVLPASALPPTTNVNGWTKAAGLTDTVNGVASNVTIPAGTIVETLGYDAAGKPVYQTAAAPVLVTDNANGTVTVNAGVAQTQNTIRPINEQVALPPASLTAGDKFTVLDATSNEHRSITLAQLRDRLQSEISVAEVVQNAPGGVIPQTRTVEGVTVPIDTYVDYNGSHVPNVTLPVPLYNGQRLVFNHLSIFDTTVGVANSSMTTPLVVTTAMAGAEWVAVNGKWHLTTERPAAASAPVTPASISSTGLLTMGGQTLQLRRAKSAIGDLLDYYVIPV